MIRRALPFLLASLFLAGSATASAGEVSSRARFDFTRDTFSYVNQTVWRYHMDPATGREVATRKKTPATYSRHCAVVVRAAKQFFDHARFEPFLPKVSAATYRRLVREVIASPADTVSPERDRIEIPGYSGLRAFSKDHEAMLKQECGGAWESYFHRGNWRMILPFPRRGQAETAHRLIEELRAGRVAVVWLIRFPQLSINHALLLYGVRQEADEVEFSAYDPNVLGHPSKLVFHRKDRTFTFPRSFYFAGGKVNVYEIYRNLIF